MSLATSIASRTLRVRSATARRSLYALGVATLLCAAGGASAAGSIERGQEKSATCAACHGAEGIATAPQWPILAGQYTDYIEHSLKAYRSGARQNAIMQGFASQLSDEDIEDLAAWFNSREATSLDTAPRADSNN